MNNLENETFRITDQKPIYEEYYSYFLNELLKAKNKVNCRTKDLMTAFKCSKGTIWNFENRVKNYDFIMLFKYAGFFRFNLTMHLDQMTYEEKISI